MTSVLSVPLSTVSDNECTHPANTGGLKQNNLNGGVWREGCTSLRLSRRRDRM